MLRCTFAVCDESTYIKWYTVSPFTDYFHSCFRETQHLNREKKRNSSTQVKDGLKIPRKRSDLLRRKAAYRPPKSRKRKKAKRLPKSCNTESKNGVSTRVGFREEERLSRNTANRKILNSVDGAGKNGYSDKAETDKKDRSRGTRGPVQETS